MTTPLADRFQEVWQEYVEANHIAPRYEPFVKAVFERAYNLGYEHGADYAIWSMKKACDRKTEEMN